MNTLRIVFVAALALALPLTVSAQDTPRFAVEVEAGPVFQTRNDVRIPNNASATRFSIRDLVGSGPWPAGRVYVTWNINERHGLRALVAPLSITETGVPGQTVDFAGAGYSPGAATQGTYKFNSYRLTWRYRFRHGARWTWWVGLTAKVRDANIELRQGGTTSRKTDLGFVPLLHLAADGRLAPRWHLILDVDALAGGPGRAEDVAIKVGYDVGRRWTLAGGYRTVEGGADVDAVYTFAWLHYAVLSAAYRF
jgi:hypothetical protein